MRRRRNPNRFTTDEAQTATLMMAEGSLSCWRRNHKYVYPAIDIRMCDREALEPASRVLKKKLGKATATTIQCPPQDFPPDGKGIWRVSTVGQPAKQAVQRLSPLLTQRFKRKWQETVERCKPL